MIVYEIYVVDVVKAAIWWGSPVALGEIVSRGTIQCDTTNCRQCGVFHGVADPITLEKNGLAARRV